MKNQEPTAELIAFLGSLQLAVNEYGDAQCLGLTAKEYATLTVRARAAGYEFQKNGALIVEANGRRVVLNPGVLGDRPLVSAWYAPNEAKPEALPVGCSIRSVIPVMLDLLPSTPRTALTPDERASAAHHLAGSSSGFRQGLALCLDCADAEQLAAIIKSFPKDIHWALTKSDNLKINAHRAGII